MALIPSTAKAKRLYIETMMTVIGRAIQAISQIDNKIKNEVSGLPDEFSFQMKVMPSGPAFTIKKTIAGELRYLGGDPTIPADVSISFKHMTHAFMVLSFQESTATAFAHDRMLVDGDISYALRVTRILNRLETFILPKLLAERALKEYPRDIQLPEKILQGARVYFQMATNLVTENLR